MIMQQGHPFPTENHYIRFSITPSTQDVLILRKALSDALTQTFGTTCASIYLDILWVSEQGTSMVIRVKEE